MKIAWIVLDDITPGIQNESTAIRARAVALYMLDATICSSVSFVQQCDAVIYQDRFAPHDLSLARELKELGKVIVMDLSIPIWYPGHPLSTSKLQGLFREMAKLSSCTVVPNQWYKDSLESTIEGLKVEVIPSRGISRAKESAEEYISLLHSLQENSRALHRPSKFIGVDPVDNTDDVSVGFVPHQSIDREQIAAGTRIRVLNIVKHLKNCVVSYNYEDLKACDVVIFQARWLATDMELARKLKEQGVKLVFDTTDPHWDTQNFDSSGRRKEALDKILEHIGVVTFPTEGLKDSFLRYRKDKRIEIIPDCVDLSKHTETREHKEKSVYTIVWYGCSANVCSIDLARRDLERLGQEFNLKLIAVYDLGHGAEVKPFDNLELETREWSEDATILAILESDVAINPRYDTWRGYKSNNKTAEAWSLGVPCVERNFYSEIRKYLLSEDLRNEEGRKGKERVVELCSKKVARKLYDLCSELAYKKPPRKKNKIAVVTAIVGGFDVLHDPKYYDTAADYIAYVDQETKSNTWRVLSIDYTHFTQPRMAAKLYKILTHKYCEYDYLIWVDGSLELLGSATELIEFLDDADMALFKHRFRSGIYEEHEASFRNVHHAKGEPRSVRIKQIERYRSEGLPVKYGLYECTLIVRRNTEKVQRFNEFWWSEIAVASSSDQVPFMYALWRNPEVKVATISPGNAHESKWTHYIEHRGHKNV